MTELAARLDAARERLQASTIRVAGQDDLRPFFTPKTLAQYLAVSERTVRQMVADRRIASYRVEGQRRIDHKDVESYLAGRRSDAA
ncbi:MAG: helix-turn-helix domain-containing protein [Actinocrinis sp.]